jgi:uncharacterized protein (TIGR03083 family)
MESSAARWIEVLRHSYDTLRAMVEPLDDDRLSAPSYANKWSIAQVLSHLGSGAEIFGMFVEAGLNGSEPPGGEAFGPIWAVWNAKSPAAQAADALRVDGALVQRLESLDDTQLAALRLALFGQDLDAAAMARMRLSEHAIHSWDIAVAIDPTATVAEDAVVLLVDTLDQLAARVGKPAGDARSVRVSLTDPAREFVLETADTVTLTQAPGDGAPDLRLPAEAFIRLLYGRLDPANTPRVQGEPAILDDLRPVFPGF